MNNKIARLTQSCALIGAAVLVNGCSSGSFGSDVGDSQNAPPTARAQVLNVDSTGNFREGSEVLLTGKDSEDADGPVVGWQWSQAGGPSVMLVEKNTTTVSFTAGDVSAPTILSFTVTVTDSDQVTSQASVDVTVVPAQDANEFLSLDLRSGSSTTGTFDSFKAIAALGDGGATGAAPMPFTVSAVAYLVYPPRSNMGADCTLDLAEFAPGIPDMTASGCLVRMLEDLTPGSLPGGGTGMSGQWPANAPVPGAGQTTGDLISAWWNPRFSIDIPRLDVGDFNQQFVDADNRGDLLDTFNVHRARILISLDLTAPQNQADASLVLTTGATVSSVMAVPSHRALQSLFSMQDAVIRMIRPATRGRL